jgi:hypothetical protein
MIISIILVQFDTADAGSIGEAGEANVTENARLLLGRLDGTGR